MTNSSHAAFTRHGQGGQGSLRSPFGNAAAPAMMPEKRAALRMERLGGRLGLKHNKCKGRSQLHLTYRGRAARAPAHGAPGNVAAATMMLKKRGSAAGVSTAACSGAPPALAPAPCSKQVEVGRDQVG